MEAYYDQHGARDFDCLFAGTYIARHKTPYQGGFRVLRLDLADIVDPADGSRALCDAVRKGFADFFRRYPIPHWKTLLEKDCIYPGSLLHEFLSEVHYRSESPGIMLLIDNFDCLTRPLINDNANLIHDWRTPHYLRSFFKPFEYFINNGLLDFVYVMGETLLGLEYLTSDGPDVQHLCKKAHFAAFAGLTEEDFRRLIDTDALLAGVSPTEIFDEMQHFCGSYQFTEQRPYNSNVVSVYPTAEVLRFITAGRATDQTTRDLESYASDDLEKLVRLYAEQFPQDIGEIIRTLGSGRPVPYSGGYRLGDRFFFRYNGLLTLLFGLCYLTLSIEGENELLCPTRAIERRFEQLADEIRRRYPDAHC